MSHLLSFPILGNPHGRIMEIFPSPLSEPEILRKAAELINRYGDLLPMSGVAEVHRDSNSPEYEIVFTRNFDDLPTTLEFRNPPGNPDQQVLPGL